jgi:hemoglobin/transferrin/lactoferrin receptor protein
VNKILIFILLCLSYNFVCAQSKDGNLLLILDKTSGSPVEMAAIGAKNPDVIARTNAKGIADISQMIGKEEIEIRAYGYRTLKTSFNEIVKGNFVLEMESSFLEIETMVVSATRWEQSTKDIPNKITVISSKDVAFQNPQTAADLLGSSGEVFIQKSQQGGGSPMIRGFSTNRLLYTIDGVRMNNAIFRGGNIQNVISLDPLGIESTEVFFGSGSVVYGSDAIGAVMSFKTLRPVLSNTDKTSISGKALSRFSTANNEKTYHFDANVGWKKWAFVTSLTHSDYGDLRMGKNGPDEYLRKFYVQRIDSTDVVIENENPLVQSPTGYSQINLMEKILFSPNKNLNMEYALHYSETSSYSRYDRLIELSSDGTPRSAVWNYGPQRWMMNQLTIDHHGDNKVYDYLSVRIAQQMFEESRIDRNFSGGNRFRLRTQKENVNAYSVNIDFEKEFGRQKLFYGVEGVLNQVISKASAYHIITGEDIAVADRYPQSDWNSYAAFLNYQWHANEKFMVQAGARFGQYGVQSDFSRNLAFYPFDFTSTSITNEALTGSLGFVYTPKSTWRITMNASTGFRAPNVDDIGKLFDINGQEIVVPNSDLKGEYAYTGEMNIARVIGNRVKIDLTGFYTQLENAMVRRAFQVNGNDSILYDGQMSKVYAIQNAAFGNVYGANFGIEIKLSKEFSLSSRYNFQKGVEEMDNGTVSPSRHAAPAFGVTRLTMQVNKLRLQAYAMYAAEVSHDQLNPEEQQKPNIYALDGNGNTYSPGWYTLNFKAMYEINDFFTVTAGIENIADLRYRPYSSGLVAAGRNISVSLRANF